MGPINWIKSRYKDFINSAFVMEKYYRKIHELNVASILPKEVIDEIDQYKQLLDDKRTDLDKVQRANREANEKAEEYLKEKNNAENELQKNNGRNNKKIF